MINHDEIAEGTLISRIHTIWCCPCYFPCNFLFHSCRKKVSKHKNRFEKEGFDLDLTYITDRIIVHGFPATGFEHVYRNPRLELLRFLDFYHENNYMCYNFCCEPGRGYDPNNFHGRVKRYPFRDHTVPPLETMVAFANHAKLFLDDNPSHVVNLHCLAGKGRAGVMCCVLLIRTGYCKTAKEALQLYDNKRVIIRHQALTLTSQRKFVVFYEALWRKYWEISGDIGAEKGDCNSPQRFIVPEQPMLHLIGLELVDMNQEFVRNVIIKVYKGTNSDPILLYDSQIALSQDFNFTCDCKFNGNFKIHVQQVSKSMFGKPKKLFELWHNTLFMKKNSKRIEFGYNQLDVKPKMLNKIGERMKLIMLFKSADRK